MSIMGQPMFAHGGIKRAYADGTNAHGHIERLHGTLRAANRSGGHDHVLPRDPARSRPPVDRPLDVVGLELATCVTQAFLAGILLSLASDLGGDARAAGLPVPGVLALLGLGVLAVWGCWLVGSSGWPLAAVDTAVAILAGSLWLLSLQDAKAPHVDPLTGLVAVSCAVYGIIAGAFLPGPRRRHWKGGASRPRRGLPDTRSTPARFSPPVQRVVDERLAGVSVGAALASVRLPRVSLARRDSVAGTSDGRSTTDADANPSLTPAIEVPPAIELPPAPEMPPATEVAPTTKLPPATVGRSGPAVDQDAPTVVHRIAPANDPSPDLRAQGGDRQQDLDETTAFPSDEVSPSVPPSPLAAPESGSRLKDT